MKGSEKYKGRISRTHNLVTGKHLFCVIKEKKKTKVENVSVTLVTEDTLISCSQMSLIWDNVFKFLQCAKQYFVAVKHRARNQTALVLIPTLQLTD